MSQSPYKPEKGTEDLVHVSVTKKNGQEQEPQIEQYTTAIWPSVDKLNGFTGEVVHDPRSKEARAQKVSASTVKSTEKLTEAQQYEERYKILFRSAVPDELVGNEARIKAIVDRAEAKLADLSGDEKPVNELLYQASQSAPAKSEVELDMTQPITEAPEAPAKKK